MCLYTSIYRWNDEKCVNRRNKNSTNLHHLFTQSQFQTLGTRLKLILLSCQSARMAIGTALHLPIISPNGQKLVQSLQRRLHMLLPSCTAWFLDTGAHKRSSQIKVGNYATSLLIPLKSELGSGTRSPVPIICNPMDWMSGLIKWSSISFKGLSMITRMTGTSS